MVETKIGLSSGVEIQRYESYKDSGVSWLDEIPKHWELKRFKHLFKEKKITHNVDLKCGSISFGKVVYKDDEKIPVSTKKSYQVLNKGEFLINPLNLNYDLKSLRIGLSDKDVVVSSGYIIVQNISELSKDYFKWLLHIFDVAYMKTLGSGVRQTLSFTHIANSELVFPPLPEQTAIAQFLDDKTTKIDQAIAIKQQQIALLKERKQIFIHKAVTRGLNDNVALKDSGVEWIGEIPEHWEVISKMKYISSMKGRQGWQGLKANEYTYEGPYVLSSAHFNNYIIDWTKCPRVSLQRYLMDENIQLREDDILLMKDGANMGKLAFVNSLPGLACLNSHLLLFRPLVVNKEITYYPKYLFFHMMCDEFQDYVRINGTGATFLGISQESMGNYPISLPPLSEQKEIAQYIETASAKIETAISLKEREISKLQEYKSSLINSVVTGKIRVC